VSTIEDEITELFAAEERRAPQASAAMSGIEHGIARRKQRRVSGIAAVVVAVAAAITVPVALHGSPRPHPSSPPKHYVGMTRTTIFAPGWLPAGFVEENERYGQLRRASQPGDPIGAYSGRMFYGKGDETASITDSSRPMAPQKGATPVRIGGRTGQAWFDGQIKDYHVEVRWRAGHWLDVAVSHFTDNNATAVRVAESVVERKVIINVPITCSACASLNVFSIMGPPDDVYTMAYGDSLIIEVDPHADSKPTTKSVGYGLYIHVGSLPKAKHPLSQAQCIAIAKTARLAEAPDYSWMNGRP